MEEKREKVRTAPLEALRHGAANMTEQREIHVYRIVGAGTALNDRFGCHLSYGASLHLHRGNTRLFRLDMKGSILTRDHVLMMGELSGRVSDDSPHVCAWCN